MKKGLVNFSAFQVAGLRLTIAGLALLPFAFKYMRQVKARDILPLIIVAVFGNGIPYFLFAFAQTQLDSSLTGMLNSLVPLFTLLISLFVFKNPMPGLKIIGVLVGLFGAVLLLSDGDGISTGNLEFGSLVILATICYAISVNTLKARLTHFNPLATAAIPLLMMALPSGIIVLLTTPLSPATYTESHWFSFVAIAVLGLIGTATALILFNRLIQLSSAVFASSVTYLIPLFALLWGLVDGESVFALQIIGLLLVMAAVYMINSKERKLV